MTIRQQKADTISFLDSLNNSPTVLYIDDEPQNLISFKAMFRREFKIYTASNEQEALEILENHNIDKLIADYKMPKTNGLQIIDKVKEIYPKVKAAIVTAYSEEIRNNTCLVLLKPFEVKEINNYLCS